MSGEYIIAGGTNAINFTCEQLLTDMISSDYNYEPQSDGSCGLVPGLSKPNPMTICQNPESIEYWEPTGYRRIPLTTCTGGLNLDRLTSKPCPNKDKEYNEKHGISGIGLFFAIATPIGVAVGIGYYAYTRWNGKFGEIRLGEDTGTSNIGGGWFSRDSKLIAIPVAIVAGTVAVIKTMPLLVSSLWRSTSGYIRVKLGLSRGSGRGEYHRGAGGVGTGRGPYSRTGAGGRGDYASVVDDEDELLGVEDPDGDEEED